MKQVYTDHLPLCFPLGHTVVLPLEQHKRKKNKKYIFFLDPMHLQSSLRIHRKKNKYDMIN